MMRRLLVSGGGLRATTKQARYLQAPDGVTDDDRRWWEWHIPTRQHKGGQTTSLYLDGVGRYTWKMLIERDIFTVEDVAALTGEDLLELERNGCQAISVASEHAKVFMLTMKERERELSLQQSSWDKEVDRILKEREDEQTAHRAKWELEHRQYLQVCLFSLPPPPPNPPTQSQAHTTTKQAREASKDYQKEQVQRVIETTDFGPSKLRHQESRFEAVREEV